MYTLEFSPTALKELKKLPKNIQKQIITKLEYFLSANNPLLFPDLPQGLNFIF